jgi:hypothetical protein
MCSLSLVPSCAHHPWSPSILWQGLAKLKTSEQSPTRMGRASSKGKAEDEEEDIVKRRLSVTNMFDEDSEWEKAGEEEDDDEH